MLSEDNNNKGVQNAILENIFDNTHLSNTCIFSTSCTSGPEKIAKQTLQELRKDNPEGIYSLASENFKKTLSKQQLQQLHTAFQSIQGEPEICEIPGKKSFSARLVSIRFKNKNGPSQLVLMIDANDKLCYLALLPDAVLPKLTKEQMLEDFDFMTEKLRNTFPLAQANRELFGIDVWDKLAKYRAQITEDESLLDFAELLEDALTACKGNHLWLSGIPYMFRNNPFAKDLFTVTEEE